MDQYYSPSTSGFYNEAIHGPRLIADPLTEKQIKAGRTPKYRPNPECAIPADAIVVDEAAWRRLMVEQGDGKIIAVEGGRVVAIDPPTVTAEEQLAAIRVKRDRLLVATDTMVSVPDYPISAEQREQLLAWRQALRDFPDQVAPTLPSDAVEWPARPSWLGENGELL
jgi:hypothetical protein